MFRLRLHLNENSCCLQHFLKIVLRYGKPGCWHPGRPSYLSAYFLQHTQIDVISRNTRSIQLGITYEKHRPVTTLEVDGKASTGNNTHITISCLDRSQVKYKPLPELALTVIRLSLIKARKLSIHVHHFLAVWMLRRCSCFDDPSCSWLPIGIGVPVRPVIEINTWELCTTFCRLIPGFILSVHYG